MTDDIGFLNLLAKKLFDDRYQQPTEEELDTMPAPGTGGIHWRSDLAKAMRGGRRNRDVQLPTDIELPPDRNTPEGEARYAEYMIRKFRDRPEVVRYWQDALRRKR